MTAFEAARALVARVEGGYAPDGFTAFGIDARFATPAVAQAIRSGTLTFAMATQLYRKKYWLPYGFDVFEGCSEDVRLLASVLFAELIHGLPKGRNNDIYDAIRELGYGGTVREVNLAISKLSDAKARQLRIAVLSLYADVSVNKARVAAKGDATQLKGLMRRQQRLATVLGGTKNEFTA